MLIGITLKNITFLSNFNTSHVNVNLLTHGYLIDITADFNTSHVNVNRLWSCADNVILLDFNTSHVNVNLQEGCLITFLPLFQYISC